MEFPNPDDLPQIRADSQLRIIEQPGMNIGYLAMNFEQKTFRQSEGSPRCQPRNQQARDCERALSRYGHSCQKPHSTDNVEL